MIQIHRYHNILFAVLFIFSFGFAGRLTDDLIGNSENIREIPQKIQKLKQAIRLAENNEQWQRAEDLRRRMVAEWQQINPEIARLYRNVKKQDDHRTPDGDRPAKTARWQAPEPVRPAHPAGMERWGEDKLIHADYADDFSMDISRDGEIYVAALVRQFGAAKDSVFIYKSGDGGNTWTQWSYIFASTREFEQIELMCMDGFPGATGPSYLLLFFRFTDGWLRVGKTPTDAIGWNYYTIVDSNVVDFAVDRDYPASNYRAIVLYDSSHVAYSVRSEPSSYGETWQDKASLAIQCEDVDLAYGRNGAVYATFNGYSSGNLYAVSNLNSGDPTSWGTIETLVDGDVDTTMHAEIAATREAPASNQVMVAYTVKRDTTYDLAYVKKSGGAAWSTPAPWVWNSNLDFAFPSFYIPKINGSQNIRAVYTRADPMLDFPHKVQYKTYDGSQWSLSTLISGDSATVWQKAYAGDLDGNTPVVAYGGTSGPWTWGVYFDNSSFVNAISEPAAGPAGGFALAQNYPNPFNPSTTIRFRVPAQSRVSLEIFNSLGQRVRRLVREKPYGPGMHSVSWDGKDGSGRLMPSGIYFCRMTAGDFRQMQKMILMK